MEHRKNLKIIPGGRDALVDEARRALFGMVVSSDPNEIEAAQRRLLEIEHRLSRRATLRLAHSNS